MRITCAGALAFVSVGVALGPAMAQDKVQNRAWCVGTVEQGISLDLQIAGCTALIQSGAATTASLAIAFSNRGSSYGAKGDFDRAIADLDQAIRLKPDYVHAYFNRGGVHQKMGDYDRAIDDYDQAIRLESDFAQGYVGRGTAHRKKGDYDRAIDDYDQAIRLKPDYAIAYYDRGLAHYSKGDYDSAIADLDQYIRLAPADPDGPAARAKFIAARAGHPG
jgi:tetratricopeptide (TPR) repeat protein